MLQSNNSSLGTIVFRSVSETSGVVDVFLDQKIEKRNSIVVPPRLLYSGRLKSHVVVVGPPAFYAKLHETPEANYLNESVKVDYFLYENERVVFLSTKMRETNRGNKPVWSQNTSPVSFADYKIPDLRADTTLIIIFPEQFTRYAEFPEDTSIALFEQAIQNFCAHVSSNGLHADSFNVVFFVPHEFKFTYVLENYSFPFVCFIQDCAKMQLVRTFFSSIFSCVDLSHNDFSVRINVSGATIMGPVSASNTIRGVSFNESSLSAETASGERKSPDSISFLVQYETGGSFKIINGRKGDVVSIDPTVHDLHEDRELISLSVKIRDLFERYPACEIGIVQARSFLRTEVGTIETCELGIFEERYREVHGSTEHHFQTVCLTDIKRFRSLVAKHRERILTLVAHSNQESQGNFFRGREKDEIIDICADGDNEPYVFEPSHNLKRAYTGYNRLSEKR